MPRTSDSARPLHPVSGQLPSELPTPLAGRVYWKNGDTSWTVGSARHRRHHSLGIARITSIAGASPAGRQRTDIPVADLLDKVLSHLVAGQTRIDSAISAFKPGKTSSNEDALSLLNTQRQLSWS